MFTRFFQHGQFLLKGFKQNSSNEKVKVTFCLKNGPDSSKKLKNPNPIFPLQRPYSAMADKCQGGMPRNIPPPP